MALTSVTPKRIQFAAAALVLGILSTPAFSTIHTITPSNFTMLAQAPDGGLVGGATDVAGSFDDTLLCNAVSCTELAMTLGSSQTFFGFNWFAHDIRVFTEGSYTFDTNCTGADIVAGITDCGGGTPLTLTVGPGQLGAHMLFDWGAPGNPTPCGLANCDIDVAVLWDLNAEFGSPIYDGAGTPNEDLTQTPTRVWNLASIDGTGDGVRGIPMVDGAFIGFHANFSLDMTPPLVQNQPPTANDDLASPLFNTPIDINVVANDTDGDGTIDPATVAITTAPANGTALSNGDGTVTYTPDLNFASPPTDSFQYTVNDNAGATSNVATVIVSVNAAGNTPPVANDLNVVTNEDTPLVVDPTSNDTDTDGNPLTILAFDTQSQEGGTVIDNGNNTLTYTPVTDFSGSDSFKYIVTDGNGGAASATVTIAVNAVNDAPVCANVPLSTAVDAPLPIDVAADLLSTCTDSEGDTLSLTSFTQPNQPGSTVVDDGAGTLTYTPVSGFTGNDSFTYTVDDGNGGSDTKTVQITVGTVQVFGNFTMLDATGVTFGGTNDVVADWDGTLNTAVTDTNFNMTFGSDSTFPFFGFPWFAHDIRVFGPGSYSFDTSCTVAQLQAGTAVCQGGPFLDLTIGAGQIGAHVLFDWNVTDNIDVALLWDSDGVFTSAPGGELYQGAAGPTPSVTDVYQLVSRDADGDGIAGARMVDGPFIDFRANFNINLTQSAGGGGPVVAPVSSIPTPSLGGTGCVIVGKAVNPGRGDWLILSVFIASLGALAWRRRRRLH